MRTFGMLLLLAGLAVVGYGVWLYHQADHAFDFDTARSVVESGNTPHAIWIGGGMIIIGGIAMFMARGRRSS
jgi:hypothetical protein